MLLLMAVGAIFAFPLSGRLSDRIGASKVTWRIAFGYAGSLFLIAASSNYTALAASLFIFGATHGAMDVAMNTWAGEAERRIGRPVMSSFHAMFSLGAGLGAGSGFVAASYDMTIIPHFLVAGILVSIVTLTIAKIDWVSDRATSAKHSPMAALPKGPLLAVGFVAFCASLGEGGMADWSAIFLVLVTGTTEAQAALGYMVFSIAMVCMRLLGDRVTQAFGAARSAQLAGITAAMGVVCAVTFGTYLLSLLGFALMGIGYAVIMPLAFSRAANDPIIPPGAAIASVSTLGYGGILLGPPLIGFAAEATSIRIAFLMLAVLASMIVVLSKAVMKSA
jgi:MFS family permease